MAAGRGVRAQPGEGGEPKQFRPLGGVPLLLWAIRAFAQHPRVGPIVVVLAPEHAKAPPEWLRALLSDRLLLAAGGEFRQQSVANGLARVPAGPSLVLVHDAARPFVARDLIDRVLGGAERGEAAIPGLPLSDTVKETDATGQVLRTVPRERLVAVQTPQGFPRAMIEAAHQRAARDPSTGAATDDAALCERLAQPVRIVPGSARNIKITTLEDFALAEALLAEVPA